MKTMFYFNRKGKDGEETTLRIPALVICFLLVLASLALCLVIIVIFLQTGFDVSLLIEPIKTLGGIILSAAINAGFSAWFQKRWRDTTPKSLRAYGAGTCSPIPYTLKEVVFPHCLFSFITVNMIKLCGTPKKYSLCVHFFKRSFVIVNIIFLLSY